MNNGVALGRVLNVLCKKHLGVGESVCVTAGTSEHFS